ncbi:MAG: hypothetical protein RLZZ301_1860 [Bacteroidota bacterium]|jgi:rfaE bifunctional protein kinase chain/domain
MSLHTLFEQFTHKRILVIGDIMTDAYLIGTVERMSPEAPVPVLDYSHEERRIGGAGNVALNILALGAKAVIASVIGNDTAGQQLETQLQEAGIDTQCLLHSDERRTTIKTRVLSKQKQLLRIDTEDRHELSSSEESALKARIEAQLKLGIDGIILEDYNKGVLSSSLIEWIIQKANTLEIPTTVDPKKKNFLAYKGCTLFKPNLKELKEGLGLEFKYPENEAAFQDALEVLQQHLQHRYSFVTLSEYGVHITDGQHHFKQQAHPRNIADVSGAGDTVIATATLSLVCGAAMQEVAQLANLAGGLVCEHPGVVCIDKNELLKEALRLHN